MLAQADNGEAAAEFEQIRKFLREWCGRLPPDDERLQQRLNRAKRFQQMEGLPPDLAGELDQEIAAMTAEIERRQQAAAEAARRPARGTAAAGGRRTSSSSARTARSRWRKRPPAAAGVARGGGFLNSVRPASELSADELRQQMERAAELAKAGDLSKDQRRALQDVIREARAELRNKEPAGRDTAGPAAEQQQAQPSSPSRRSRRPPRSQQELPTRLRPSCSP